MLAGKFGLEQLLAESGKAVGATAIMRFGVDFFDEGQVHELLDGGVEGGWTHADVGVGEGFDLLHDAIAVLLAVGEGEEDEEAGGGEGKKIVEFVAK